MKVENLAEATKLVSQLKKVESFRNVACEEKTRMVNLKDTSTYMSLKVDNVQIELDDPELSHDILDSLISKYTLRATELTKQIEAL